MASRHKEQYVYGRQQTDYMWTGYRVQSRCSLCGVPLRVRQVPRKLQKGSILRNLLALTVSSWLLRALMGVQRWCSICDRPVYLRDSVMQGGIQTGSARTELDGVKANAKIQLSVELVAVLVIGRTLYRAIFRRHRSTGRGSSMSVALQAVETFLAILQFRNRGKRALQRLSSISLDTHPGVGGD